MAKKRLVADHVQTQTEINRRHQDLVASIDSQLEEAYLNIDWNRRSAAEKDIVTWVKTYLMGLTLEDPPPSKGEEVLRQMGRAITAHEQYAIAMGRGSGKTAYCISTAVYALFTGLQDFVCIICQSQRASNGILSDIWRIFQVPDSVLAQDYPEIILPFVIANGSMRRRQLFGGVPTNISRTSSQLVLPTYADQRFTRASGSLVVTRSVTGGIRGLRSGLKRPSFVLIDDIQTMESASNPEQVAKLLEIIRKDIIPLAGKERLSILQTFTPIQEDDLVAKIKDDKSWRTTTYPAVISYPTQKKLWDEYLQMWETENVELTGHTKSLQYYKDHRSQMDDGAEVFNPGRFSARDGHISMIQKLMELRRTIGEAAWASEYQMRPLQMQYALKIDPSVIASHRSNLKELEIPQENVAWVCASSDLNLSKYITTVIVVFMRDQTAHVIWHKFRKAAIPITLPEQDYYQRVYNLLAEHGKELKALGIRIDGWAIDGNGVPAKAVQDFCRNSVRACGIPAASYIGQASHLYRPYRKSRLKDDVNRTLLCGDDQEHKVSGTGRKWTFFDSDSYHEMAQKALLQAPGNVGSLSWYDGGDHSKWAIQVCAERLICKRSRPDGTTEYTWRDTGDHDALDAIGQALAAYASQGFSSGGTGRQTLRVARQKMRPKIRIV